MSKNPVKRVLALGMALAVVLSGIWINPTTVEAAAAKPTSMTLNATKKTLYPGDKFTVSVKSVKPAKANKKVSFVSSNKKVATVTSKGVVKALKVGTSTIKVTSTVNKKVSKTCKITVAPRLVAGVTLNKGKNMVLKKGSQKTLSVAVTPKNATNKSVTWKSSNKKVVSVTSKGKIKAVKAGTATITATAKDKGKKKATCTIGVYDKKLTKIKSFKLNSTKKDLKAKASFTLKVSSVTPSKGAVKVFDWKTSNAKAATITVAANTNSAKVTAVAPGKATITATATDGSGKKATCTVTVVRPVTGIAINPSSASLVNGTTRQLTANVSPSNASNKQVTWSTSAASVATVAANGLVTAKAVGTATITATAKDGSNRKGTCVITVTPIRVSSVTLSPGSLSVVEGKTGTFTATVLPANAASKNVTWTSSDPSIVTVAGSGSNNTTGTVTGKKAGTAKIYATADGIKSAEHTVTVTASSVPVTPVTGVTLDKTALEMKANAAPVTLVATVAPATATNKNVTWSSSNLKVATVKDGVVTPVADGNTTITVTADGGKTATCEVTVIGRMNAAVVVEGNSITTYTIDKTAKSYEVELEGNIKTVSNEDVKSYMESITDWLTEDVGGDGFTTEMIGEKWLAGNNEGLLGWINLFFGFLPGINENDKAKCEISTNGNVKTITLTGSGEPKVYIATLAENDNNSYDLEIQVQSTGKTVRFADITLVPEGEGYMLSANTSISGAAVELGILVSAEKIEIKNKKVDTLLASYEEEENEYIIKIDRNFSSTMGSALNIARSIEDYNLYNVYK